MRAIIFVSLTIVIAFISTGCHKEEALYLAPQVADGIQTQTFAMGENYSNQLYFNFETQETSSNEFGTWDVGFSCDGVPHAIICSGKNTSFSVARLNGIPFTDIQDINFKTLEWKYDNPGGDIDSLALANCYIHNGDGFIGTKNEVFILDLGADSALENRYIKIQFVSVVGGLYRFRWGKIFDNEINEVSIPTQKVKNYVYYSFATKAEVENEPLVKSNWDIVFTTYKESIPDKNGLIYPYIIRGALINRHKIKVAELGEEANFSQFSYSDALQTQYSYKLNEIGYDWKEYDQDANKYTIVPNKFYVLKTINDNYFKMRFIDFYDDQGIKGYPKMAWELLNP